MQRTTRTPRDFKTEIFKPVTLINEAIPRSVAMNTNSFCGTTITQALAEEEDCDMCSNNGNEESHEWKYEKAFGKAVEPQSAAIPGLPFVIVWPQPQEFPKHGLTGVVFKCFDDHGEAGAAKFFAPRNLDSAHPHWKFLKEQFLAESNISQGLGGDCVIRTFGYNKHLCDPWRPVIVMEFADATVDDLLRECTSYHRHLLLKTSLRIASGAARGLQRFHRSGLVHRDVKPSNMTIVLARQYRFVGVTQLHLQQFEAKLSDPGFASRMSTSHDHWFKQDGYKPDEQLRPGIADPRSDIFGFGKTLQELVGVCYVNDKHEAFLLERLADIANRCAENAVYRRPDSDELVSAISALNADRKRIRSACPSFR